MDKLSFIKNTIKKYGLHLASERPLSLFTISCVAVGYNKYLRKNFGISYKAMVIIGKVARNKDFLATLFNEGSITDQTEKIIREIKARKNYYNEKIFLPMNKIYYQIKNDLKIIKENIDKKPEYSLKIITKVCPQNYFILGIYNCFWRYFKEKSFRELPKGLIKQIGNDRNKISEIYPKLEELIKLSTRAMGEKVGFDGDLLRCLTLKEMKSYLSQYKLSKIKLKELKKRKSEYLYLFVERGDKEYVFTDRNIIRAIRRDFISVNKYKKIKNIKGQMAYKGIARAIVYNRSSSDHKVKKIKNFILVAVMTHPNDVPLIKKSLAVITDEGSILSHAAIICRELKKPCIIGTKIATKVLKDGQIVEVDANRGIVKILK